MMTAAASGSAPDGGDEMGQLMTDADFERALDALHADGVDADVGDLLRAMNENRIISWEEAERILCDATNEPVKSSLPPQTRPTEPENDTDVDSSIRRLLQNDPKLVEINLNNMKRTPIPQIKRILEAIRENTCLEKISLANMGLYDTDVAPLIEVIEDNETLRAVNVETNYLSGEFFARLLRAALKNQTLEEIKAVNQGVSFSTGAEREIIDAVFENRGLTKVSLSLRLPEGRHKIEQATIRNLEIRRILRRQAAEAARAAAAAEAAKAAAIAARMADISPGKISTAGKPPTKKQQEAMAAAAAAAAAAAVNRPMAPAPASATVSHPPRNVDTPRPSLPADKPVLRRLNRPVDAHDAADAAPSAVAPAILGQRHRSGGERAERTVAPLADHRRDGRAMDDDEDGWRPPGSPTKAKPMVRKLSNDLESIYAKKDGNEAKVAYIPEAPIGRASLIARKFEKKDASARREAERSARRWPTARRLTDHRIHVPAVVPEQPAELEPEPVKETDEPTADTVVDQPKSVSNWRRRRDEEEAAQTKPNQPDLSVKSNGQLQNKPNSQLSKEDRGDTVASEPIAREVEPARSGLSETNESRSSDRYGQQREEPVLKDTCLNSKAETGGPQGLKVDVDPIGLGRPSDRITSKSPRRRPLRKAEAAVGDEAAGHEKDHDTRTATKMDNLKPESDPRQIKSSDRSVDDGSASTRMTSKSPRRKPLVKYGTTVGEPTSNRTAAAPISGNDPSGLADDRMERSSRRPTKKSETDADESPKTSEYSPIEQPSMRSDEKTKAEPKRLITTESNGKRPPSKSPGRRPLKKSETTVSELPKSSAKSPTRRPAKLSDKIAAGPNNEVKLDSSNERPPSKSPGRRPLKKSETTVDGRPDLRSDALDHAGSRRPLDNVDGGPGAFNYGKSESNMQIEERDKIESEEKTAGLNGENNPNGKLTPASISRCDEMIGKESERKSAQDIIPNANSSLMEPEKKPYEPLTTRPKRIYGDLKRRIDAKPVRLLDSLQSTPSKSNGSDTMTRSGDHMADYQSNSTVRYAFDRSDTRSDDRSSTLTANERTNGSGSLRRYRAFDSVDAGSLSNSQRSNVGGSDAVRADSNGAGRSIAPSEYVPLSTRPLRRQPPVPSPKPTRRF